MKIDILNLEEKYNNISGRIKFENKEYEIIIRKGNNIKKIMLPFEIGQRIPLKNYTFRPHSVLRLIVKISNSKNVVKDELFVKQLIEYKEKADKEGLWLQSTSQNLQIESDLLFNQIKNLNDSFNQLELIKK